MYTDAAALLFLIRDYIIFARAKKGQMTFLQKGRDAIMSAMKGKNNLREQSVLEEGNVFQNISKRLYQNAVPVFMKKGGILIQKGEKADCAYYIVSGKVYVQSEFLDGNVYQFSYLGKGAIVSDIEVLSGTYINAATLIVAEDMLALKIPIKLFAEELRTNLDFLYHVSTSMANKMYNSSYERGQNLLKKGIFKVVLYLIRCYEMDELEEETVKIRKTRPVIASEIGISIKTLNRSIEQLHEKNQISIERGKITINEKQFQQLIDLAEEEALY